MKRFNLLVFLPERSAAPFREMSYAEAVEVVSVGDTQLACFVCARVYPARQLYTMTSTLKRHLVPLCTADADRAITHLGDFCVPLDEVVLKELRWHERSAEARPGGVHRRRRAMDRFLVADSAAAAKLLRIRFSLAPSDN